MIVKLKEGKEKNLKWKHPWIFSGAIEKAPKKFEPNVKIESAHGECLGRGYYNPNSQIAVRMLSFTDCYLDRTFFKQLIVQAFERRKHLINQNNNAMRIIASEVDGLPGLIVDQYNNVLVTQFLTAGMDFYRHIVIDLLQELFSPLSIWDRSDDQVREKEGLKITSGLVGGVEPPDRIEIMEHGYKLYVDVRNGHKTGFYLDQKDSRGIIKEMSQGKSILNCFCYTGGFSIAALKGGASDVTSVDMSAPALEILNSTIAANNLEANLHTSMKGDVFELLRNFKEQNKSFDMIILDPPKFVHTKADLTKASRGYKDINRIAFQLLKPNGLLATFSCSGHMDELLFQKIVFSAALDAGCNGQIIKRFMQAEDHPILLTFPESHYLKGLLVRKT